MDPSLGARGPQSTQRACVIHFSQVIQAWTVRLPGQTWRGEGFAGSLLHAKQEVLEKLVEAEEEK